MSPRQEQLLDWLQEPKFMAHSVSVSYVYHYSGRWNRTGKGPDYKSIAEARRDLNALEKQGRLLRNAYLKPIQWEIVQMSSDDFIGVFSSKDSLGRDIRWYVAHGMMLNIEDSISEVDWKKYIINNNDYRGYPTREAALVAAHDLLKKEKENPYSFGVEYGVLEI